MATAFGVVHPQIALRVTPFDQIDLRLQRPHIRQAEMVHKLVAIIERLFEQPSGIEKQHRERGIDIGDEFQKHRGFRAEGGYHCKPALRHMTDRRFDHLLRRCLPERFVQLDGIDRNCHRFAHNANSFEILRPVPGWPVRRHKAPASPSPAGW